MRELIPQFSRPGLAPFARRLGPILADEQGGAGLHMIWSCFLLMLLIPFLWDVGSVHYTRRFAGTGADAGSLAAAQEYARQLHYVPEWNGIFRGSCPLQEYTPQQVVLRYRTLPAFGAPPGLGRPQAESYAARNRAPLTAYSSWPEYSGTRFPAGVPVPVIKVRVDTERRTNTAYSPIYGREFLVPHKAQAVAYLRRWTVTPRPCYENGSFVANTYDFTFEWKITLDTLRD
jgi:hypothetical protein